MNSAPKKLEFEDYIVNKTLIKISNESYRELPYCYEINYFNFLTECSTSKLLWK
jgi:hypothetical protein